MIKFTKKKSDFELKCIKKPKKKVQIIELRIFQF